MHCRKDGNAKRWCENLVCRRAKLTSTITGNQLFCASKCSIWHQFVVVVFDFTKFKIPIRPLCFEPFGCKIPQQNIGQSFEKNENQFQCHMPWISPHNHFSYFTFRLPKTEPKNIRALAHLFASVWNVKCKNERKRHFYRTRTLFTNASVGRLAIRRFIKCLNTLNEIWWDDDRRLLVHVQRSLAHTHT